MTLRTVVVAVASALLAVMTGCATKRYVRENVDPVNRRVSDLDSKTAASASAIRDLDEKTSRQISRLDERIGSADARATEAARVAGQANSQAGQAAERAEAARTLAESGTARTGRLEKMFESVDQLRAGPTFTAYFDFGQSELGEEAKRELDKVPPALPNQGRFMIEVQGFTDTTGSPDYNYALSERRADAVVRYLITRHKVAGYRIHSLGLGQDSPAQASDRREARRLSRRVEVRLYLPSTPQ